MPIKTVKKYPAPGGPDVEFVLMANSQYKKGECIPIDINGYKHYAVVGQKNTLPQQVLQALQDAKSRTEVVDTEQYDPTRGGMPRKQEDFYAPKKTHVYQSEYDIEIIKVHDK
jgi:hypothetical protein